MTARKQPKTRPNPSAWTDADYAETRGLGRISLRLPVDALVILEAESERSGYTRSELVETAIRLHCDPRRTRR